jgi:hypothetical protein
MNAKADAFTDAAAWFAAGNTDERFTTLALENLLAELSAMGRSPLAVYSGPPPFSTPPLRIETKSRLGKGFEHYTSAEIPAVRLETLVESLKSAKQRERCRAEGSRFGTVMIRGASIPDDGLPTVADGILMLLAKGIATPGWVYKGAKILHGRGEIPPICIVVVNSTHLEEAAAFFHEVKDEVCALLKKEVPFKFAGFLKFDPDYVNSALDAKRPLIQHFPGSPFHGQIKYVVKALLRAVLFPPVESFLERMAAAAEAGRGSGSTPHP